ncbi:TPA: hypothetical protein ACP7Q5_004906 [Escherichia coli]|jgi:hypothetical protein|nr:MULTISPECIES: hypothetical protein [Bacilli]ELG7156060.1 hypothetical protein [Staphylococcus aureus]ELL1200978.1 hypothetical protein [Staphylococcus aureus]MDH9287430.1 hypothetical protein [Staphylococcus epidermidis]MDN3040506.1 hypothetical protein [Enterococcus faecium]MDS3932007.1 hypothetical protein [Staphylococcus epidermidis]
MADFCSHCSILMWGEDTGDFRGIGPVADDDGRPWYYTVLCETCGPIQVDGNGARVTPLEEQDDQNRHIAPGQFFDYLPPDHPVVVAQGPVIKAEDSAWAAYKKARVRFPNKSL